MAASVFSHLSQEVLSITPAAVAAVAGITAAPALLGASVVAVTVPVKQVLAEQPQQILAVAVAVPVVPRKAAGNRLAVTVDLGLLFFLSQL
jgi:hypothetical protein